MLQLIGMQSKMGAITNDARIPSGGWHWPYEQHCRLLSVSSGRVDESVLPFHSIDEVQHIRPLPSLQPDSIPASNSVNFGIRSPASRAVERVSVHFQFATAKLTSLLRGDVRCDAIISFV